MNGVLLRLWLRQGDVGKIENYANIISIVALGCIHSSRHRRTSRVRVVPQSSLSSVGRTDVVQVNFSTILPSSLATVIFLLLSEKTPRIFSLSSDGTLSKCFNHSAPSTSREFIASTSLLFSFHLVRFHILLCPAPPPPLRFIEWHNCQLPSRTHSWCFFPREFSLSSPLSLHRLSFRSTRVRHRNFIGSSVSREP